MDTQVTVKMIVEAAQRQERPWIFLYSVVSFRVFEREGVRVVLVWKDERPLSLKEWEALIESFGF